MLVVIVVAAATAFSFFVAAYERQVLSEENQQHDRTLEKGMVSGIQLCTTTTCPNLYCNGMVLPDGTSCTWQRLPAAAIAAEESAMNISFVSADVNPMFFTDYQVNGEPPQAWLFYPQSGAPRWMFYAHEDPAGWSACQPTESFNGTNVSANDSCTEISPYGQVNVTLLFSGSVTSPVNLEVYTSLANEFTYDFTPPVAILKTSILPQGSYSEPLFDGSGSYQPAGGDNASIVSYSWIFVGQGSAPSVQSAQGPEVEVSGLSSEIGSYTYLVTLTVANSDGLIATASVYYET